MRLKEPPKTVPIYCSRRCQRDEWNDLRSWNPGRKAIVRGQVLAVRIGEDYFCESCGRVVRVAW